MKQIATFITINKLKVKILGILAGFCPKSATCGICFMNTYTKESVLAKPEYACISQFSAVVSVLLFNVQKKIWEFFMVILFFKTTQDMQAVEKILITKSRKVEITKKTRSVKLKQT